MEPLVSASQFKSVKSVKRLVKQPVFVLNAGKNLAAENCSELIWALIAFFKSSNAKKYFKYIQKANAINLDIPEY